MSCCSLQIELEPFIFSFFQRSVRVVTLREGKEVPLSLKPQTWSGRGLLG